MRFAFIEVLTSAALRAGLNPEEAKDEIERFCNFLAVAPEQDPQESRGFPVFAASFPAIDSYVKYMIIEDTTFPTTIRFIAAPSNYEVNQELLKIFPSDAVQDPGDDERSPTDL